MKLVLIPTLLFSLAALAQSQRPLPQVSAPAELESGAYAEGTMTRLTEQDVAEFLPWAQNARNQLTRALTQARNLPLRERPEHIERAVRAVVDRSGSRQYQMFLRFALNRGMLLVDELERNVNMNEIGSQENALDLLSKAITVGLEFYESDLAFQQRAQSGDTAIVLPYARFGVAFMQAMYPGVVNVLDAGAQYRLLFKLVEMTNWDLSRDAQAALYAETIVEAHEMTVGLPEQPSQDDRANLRMIRRLNGLRIIAPRPDAVTAAETRQPEARPEVRVPETTPAVAERPAGAIRSGDTVIETSGSYSVQRVASVASDGTVRLADGYWYNSSDIVRLVTARRTISVGDHVIETSGSYSVLRVTHIGANGVFRLSDGYFYEDGDVKALLTSRGGINVGDAVMETSGSYSILRVTHISGSLFRLSDGYFYNSGDVKRLANSVGNLRVGQRVVETSGSRSEQTVTHLSADGRLVRLSDGYFYDRGDILSVN